MTKQYPLVVTKQRTEEFTKWLKVIKRGENISLLFFPKIYRILYAKQLIDNAELQQKILGDKNRYSFIILNLDSSKINDINSLNQYLASKLNEEISSTPKTFDKWISYYEKRRHRLIVFVPEADLFLEDQSKHILDLLSRLADKYQHLIQIVSMFAVDITHPMFVKLLPSSTILYQNIHYYPLYTKEDTSEFIDYLSKKWNFELELKMKDKIISEYGGHWWFVKEVVRQIATGDHDPFAIREGIKFRMQTVYDLLLPTEQKVLEKLITNKDLNKEEQHSLDYLKKMRFIDPQNQIIGVRFRIFLNELLITGIGSLELNDGRITLNQIPLHHFFSRQEYRVMKYLLGKKNQVVTRDEIAKCIWPLNTENYYSDWAIDQVILRLRKRMTQLSITPKILKSVRGKGYILKLE